MQELNTWYSPNSSGRKAFAAWDFRASIPGWASVRRRFTFSCNLRSVTLHKLRGCPRYTQVLDPIFRNFEIYPLPTITASDLLAFLYTSFMVYILLTHCPSQNSAHPLRSSTLRKSTPPSHNCFHTLFLVPTGQAG